MKKIPLILFICFVSLRLYSQGDHKISNSERLSMPSYLERINRMVPSGITQPPSFPVRTSAEWEEIDALMVAWTNFPTILTQIVMAAQSETDVIVICSDSNSVKSTLTNASVPLTNVRFLVAPFNTIWCRDYGQWNIYKNGVDSLMLVDWIYNRPRPDDDAVPSTIENYTGLTMYQTTASPYDLIHTGGNFMCDGFGTGFSSKLILDENSGKSESQIDTIMQKFMGINRYIKMETLPYDGIHHIDMHMKLLDEETLLVGQYPAGTADGPQIEANLQFILANYTSVFGTPYKVVRIPMPPDGQNQYPHQNGDYRTYTNSVFVNNTIILPVYDPQYDSTAIRIYNEALPGYNIVPINCNSIIPSLGAIHCITKEVSSHDPLLISHQPLRDTYNTTSDYVVQATALHRTGILETKLYYRTDTTQIWNEVVMLSMGNDQWEAAIPPQAAGSTVYYYVSTQSTSGKTQTRPMPAPSGYWKFKVLLNTGIEESKEFFSVGHAFPNPSNGLTCIPIFSQTSARLKIALKDFPGKEIIPVFSGMNAGEKKYFMNTTGLAQGVYILEIKIEEKLFTQKIVVR